MGISSYSKTAASNTSISGIDLSEGCSPAGINDAIRQLMADVATDISTQQLPTATGTANAIVVALSPATTTYVAGQVFRFLPSASNTGAATINYGGGVLNLQKRGGLALAPNDIINGVAAEVLYDGTRAVLLNPQTYTHGADIASSATLNLDNATGDYVFITGTTGISAITLADGRQVTTKFSGALTLTNSASLICPAGANYTTAAGDVIVWRGEASGVVRAVGLLPASGITVTDGSKGDVTVSSSGTVWTIAANVITYAKLAAAAIADTAAILAGTASKLVDAAGLYAVLFGVNQTWQSVTRTAGVTYTNSTNKPIQAIVSITTTGNNVLGTCQCTISGITLDVAKCGGAAVAQTAGCGSIVIPVGATYVFTDTNCSRSTWELR